MPRLQWIHRTHCPHGHDLAVVGLRSAVLRSGSRAGQLRHECRQCTKDRIIKSQTLAASRRSDPLEMIADDERARFWGRVNKTETCWVWTGRFHNKGYGATEVGGRIRLAHRVAYFAVVGPIPPGLGEAEESEAAPPLAPRILTPELGVSTY